MPGIILAHSSKLYVVLAFLESRYIIFPTYLDIAYIANSMLSRNVKTTKNLEGREYSLVINK